MRHPKSFPELTQAVDLCCLGGLQHVVAPPSTIQPDRRAVDAQRVKAEASEAGRWEAGGAQTNVVVAEKYLRSSFTHCNLWIKKKQKTNHRFLPGLDQEGGRCLKRDTNGIFPHTARSFVRGVTGVVSGGLPRCASLCPRPACSKLPRCPARPLPAVVNHGAQSQGAVRLQL